MNYRKKMVITTHAKERIKQRIPDLLGYPNERALALAARYKGKSYSEFTPQEQFIFCMSHKRKCGIVRLFKDYFFIFSNSSPQKFVTVYPKGTLSIAIAHSEVRDKTL